MPAENEPKENDAGWRKLGGATVHIGEGGIIDAGCEGLVGHEADAEHLEATQDERAAKQDAAEAAGWQSAESQEAEQLHGQAAKLAPAGTLVFVRIGDKLRTFGEHAGHAKQALGMGDGQEAEFDHEHMEKHLAKLVKAGHRVAIVERAEQGQPRHQATVGPEHAQAIDPGEHGDEADPGRHPADGTESAEAVLGRVKQSPNQAAAGRDEAAWNRYAQRFGIEGDFKHGYSDPAKLAAMLKSGHLRGSTSLDQSAVDAKAKSGQLNPVIITEEPGRQMLIVDGNHSLQAAIQRGDKQIPVIVAKGKADQVATEADPGRHPEEQAQQPTSPRAFDKPLAELPSVEDTRKAHHATYFSPEGGVIASSRTTPSQTDETKLPLGTWRKDSISGMYGVSMEQLRQFDPHTLKWGEEDYTTGVNYENRGTDARQYAEWIKQGHEPPPVHVIEMEDGSFKVTDGHRRLAAAKWAGVPIKAWVNPLAGTGKPDSEGKEIKTGATYETNIRDALAAGHEVPEHARKHYGEWLEKDATKNREELLMLADKFPKNRADYLARAARLADTIAQGRALQGIQEPATQETPPVPTQPTANPAKPKKPKPVLPMGEELSAKILDAIKASPNGLTPSELRRLTGHTKYDGSNPLKNPAHAAAKAMVDAGHLSATNPQFGEPRITATNAQPQATAADAATRPESTAAQNVTAATAEETGAVASPARYSPKEHAQRVANMVALGWSEEEAAAAVNRMAGEDATSGTLAKLQSLEAEEAKPKPKKERKPRTKHSAVEKAAEAIGDAPPKVKHLVEGLHKLDDVQQTGQGTTTNLAPGYAEAMHKHLTATIGRGDGFGVAHDLSDQLAPGAVGYHSPAGVTALVPPQFAGDPWEARYSAHVEQPKLDPWDPDVTQADLDHEAGIGDSYEGDIADPHEAERQVKVKERLGAIAKAHGPGFAQALEQALPGDHEGQLAAAELAHADWQSHAEYMDNLRKGREHFLDSMTGKFNSSNSGGGQGPKWTRGLLINAARSSSRSTGAGKKGAATNQFWEDRGAEDFERLGKEYPELFTPHKIGSDGRLQAASSGRGQGQLESERHAAFRENIGRTDDELVTHPIESFLDGALAHLDSMAGSSEDQDEDAVPFGRGAAWRRMRYAKRSKGTPAAGFFKWDEDQHPRDEGGKFATSEGGKAESTPDAPPEPEPTKPEWVRVKQDGRAFTQWDDHTSHDIHEKMTREDGRSARIFGVQNDRHDSFAYFDDPWSDPWRNRQTREGARKTAAAYLARLAPLSNPALHAIESVTHAGATMNAAKAMLAAGASMADIEILQSRAHPDAKAQAAARAMDAMDEEHQEAAAMDSLRKWAEIQFQLPDLKYGDGDQARDALFTIDNAINDAPELWDYVWENLKEIRQEGKEHGREYVQDRLADLATDAAHVADGSMPLEDLLFEHET